MSTTVLGETFRNPYYVLYNKDLDLFLKEIHPGMVPEEMSQFWTLSLVDKRVINIHNGNALNAFLRYLCGELRPVDLVDLQWKRANAFISVHHTWDDMVFVPVYGAWPDFLSAMDVM